MSVEPKYRVMTNGVAYRIEERTFDCRNDYYYKMRSSFTSEEAAWAEYDRLEADEKRKVWVIARRPLPMRHPDSRR